jgi:hypothetical protein
MRPQRVVKRSPSRRISQNLLALPSTSSKRRGAPPAAAVDGAAAAFRGPAVGRVGFGVGGVGFSVGQAASISYVVFDVSRHASLSSWRFTTPTVRWNCLRPPHNSPSSGKSGSPAVNQAGAKKRLPRREMNCRPSQ